MMSTCTVRSVGTGSEASPVVRRGATSLRQLPVFRARTACRSVALIADGGIGRYLLAREALPGRRPLVAIPTTSGTGAEVTRTCVLADDRPGGGGRKVWTWGDALLPDLIVLDPEATATMPPAVTTGTGLDAFVGLEAALGWNIEGDRAAFGAVAAALDVDVDGLASCYRSLWRDSGLPAAVALLSDVDLHASPIASTIVTEENLPMVRNNCRPSTAEDVRDLAERTVAAWAGLRATAGAAR